MIGALAVGGHIEALNFRLGLHPDAGQALQAIEYPRRGPSGPGEHGQNALKLNNELPQGGNAIQARREGPEGGQQGASAKAFLFGRGSERLPLERMAPERIEDRYVAIRSCD